MRNSKFAKFIGVLSLVTVMGAISAPSASAVETHGGYIGPLAGLAFGGGSSVFTIGGKGGVSVTEDMTAGLWANYSSQSVSLLGANASSKLLTLAVEGDLSLAQYLEGLKVGAKVGWMRASTSGTGVPDTSSSTIALGPSLSYDFPLGGGLTIGGEGNVFFPFSGSFNTLVNLVGVLKWWF